MPLNKKQYKTSQLLCMLLYNKGEIEPAEIFYYLKLMTELGYVESNGTKLKLSELGFKYYDNI